MIILLEIMDNTYHDKMRVLVFGANGLLGQKLLAEMNSSYQIIAVGKGGKTYKNSKNIDYHEGDITDSGRVNEIIRSTNPGVIVNAAAYTNVDGCEANKEECWKTNVEGVENIVKVSRHIGAKLIHISTDYVFDGKDGPYSEDALPSPESYYGRSKLASENVVNGSTIKFAIIRTNVLYGNAVPARASFVGWVRRELSKGNKIRVVNDQFSNPTLANDLAACILRIIQLEAEGLFNYAGADYLNRFEFAQIIAEKFDYPQELIFPITTEDLGQLANRPKKAGLQTEKARDTLGLKILGIEHGMDIMIAEMNE